MVFWTILATLCLLALAFVVLPLFKSRDRLTPMLVGVIVGIVGLSAGLYHFIGSPGVPSGAGSVPDVGDMVTSLAERLEDNPDDVNGWMMLGRSYQTLKQNDAAVSAYEKAVEADKGQNAQPLVALAIALLEQQNGQMSNRAASLFENALALEPNNPNALFYGGGAAAQRGNIELAADRWEMLMSLNAPPQIQEMLQRKINEWRGLPPPVAAPQSASGVSINLTISDEARAGLPADATVYVIARDPLQPSPPVAVAPRRLSELPVSVTLTDQNSMVPGRLLSAFADLEIVARVSVSGQPMAQSGDWSGSRLLKAGEPRTVDLVIDQEVP